MKSKSFATIVLFIISFGSALGENPLDAEAAKIPSANNVHEAVEYLIRAEDQVPGDRELLRALSIDSLDEIQTQMSNTTEIHHIYRGIFLLAYKYKQYEPQINSAKRDQIVQTLVTHAELLREAASFNYLNGIDHPLVRSLALKYQDSSEEKSRVTARQLLRSLDESPKALAATNSISPTVPIKSTKDSTKQPTAVQKVESKAAPLSTASAESKPNWWIWAAGGVALLTLFTLLIKNRGNYPP